MIWKWARGRSGSAETALSSERTAERVRRRLWRQWATIALFAGALITALSLTGATSRADNLLYDQMLAQSPADVPADIVLVTLDEASLAEIGRWPWNRSTQAALIRTIAQGRPAALGYDIILSDAGEVAQDAELAAALSAIPNRVMAVHSEVPGSNGSDFDLLPPASIFAADAALGHVVITPDADGVVRRFHPCLSDGAAQFSHMAAQLATARASQSVPDLAKQESCSTERLFHLPPIGSVPQVGAADVIQGRVPPSFFTGKTVLVGASAVGLGDLHMAAGTGGEAIAGVELIAGLINALEGDWIITEISGPAHVILSLLPTILFMALVWWLSPRTLLWAAGGLTVAVLVLCVVALRQSIWIAPGPALAGLLIVYPLWGWRRLAAISEDISAELNRFADTGLAIADPPPSAVDPIAQQSAALHRMLVRQDNLRRFLDDTMQNLPDPMFATDVDGAVALMSRRAEDELGKAGANLTREETLLLLVHPEDLGEVRAFLKEPINVEATIRFRSKQGNLNYLLRRAPMVDVDGTMRAHIHYLTDITPLEEARRARDEALSLISHDLRAPQAAILAALNKPMDAEQKTFITRQAQRTMRLAESFVDLARMRERLFAGEEFLLSEIAAEVADDFHPLADAKKIRIVQDIAIDDSFVVLEMDSIVRALANIFDNAIKFAPVGSVVDVRLSEQAHEDGRAGYALSIRDHGEGIDPELLPRLFGRFQRADKARTAVPSGFGLGLSYVSAVLERHGGFARAEHAEGGGARFIVWLPAADYADVPPIDAADHDSLSSADSSESSM